MTPLLEARNLTLARGGHCLVEGLDLQIRAQECWMVLGPNGSGKTTLLKTFAGLLPAHGGQIHLSGHPLGRMHARQRARHLGLVFQQGYPGLHNSTLELVLSGHHPHRRHWWDTPEEVRAAREALRAVGLASQADQDARTLSGGELRRAEIARLLVQAPALALLDEPFNHLDIGQQVAMVRLLKKHFGQVRRALLVVAHDLNLATQAASHCLLLYGDGRWSAGPVKSLADRATLSGLFQYPLQEHAGRNGPLWGIDWEPQSPTDPAPPDNQLF